MCYTFFFYFCLFISCSLSPPSLPSPLSLASSTIQLRLKFISAGNVNAHLNKLLSQLYPSPPPSIKNRFLYVFCLYCVCVSYACDSLSFAFNPIFLCSPFDVAKHFTRNGNLVSIRCLRLAKIVSDIKKKLEKS